MNTTFDLPERLMVEAMHFMLGDKLGSGVDRDTYVYKPNPGNVIKVEKRDSGRFQNVLEWLTWNAIEQNKSRARWLAPALRISDGGTFLMMERTTPILKRDVPRKVPRFLGDLKYANWGRLADGRVVCHDYGTNIAMELGFETNSAIAKFWTSK